MLLLLFGMQKSKMCCVSFFDLFAACEVIILHHLLSLHTFIFVVVVVVVVIVVAVVVVVYCKNQQ